MSNSHGVIYTKDWIVNLILDIAGYTENKCLWKKTVVEPSCGHGSFLSRIVDRLLITAQRDNALDKEKLANALKAFDIDSDAVKMCQSMVREKLLKYGLSHDDIDYIVNSWIICDDYLLHDTVPADYVIGNPPYIRSTEIPVKLRDKYVSLFSSMTKGCDLFVGFFQKGLESLRDEIGVLCYICADRWLQNQYGRNLRKLISNNYHIDTLIRMHDVDAFETEVSAYPAITRIDLGNSKIKYINCNSSFSNENVEELKLWLESKLSDYESESFSATQIEHPTCDKVIPLSAPKTIKTVIKMMDEFPTLEGTGVKIGIGLATGRDDVFIVDTPEIVEEDRTLPMFNMRDWRRKHNTDNNWLINPWNENGELVDLANYPRLKRYYEQHKAEIANRHIAKKNVSDWYRTIDKINWSIYGTPMLLFPDMSMKADPVYSDGTRYPCHNCYWLVSNTWDIKVLGGILMSDVAESFVDALGVKMRGGTKRFQAQYLRMIHVPNPSSVPKRVAEQLKTAFENNDREAATRAAMQAYGLEELQ